MFVTRKRRCSRSGAAFSRGIRAHTDFWLSLQKACLKAQLLNSLHTVVSCGGEISGVLEGRRPPSSRQDSRTAFLHLNPTPLIFLRESRTRIQPSLRTTSRTKALGFKVSRVKKTRQTSIRKRFQYFQKTLAKTWGIPEWEFVSQNSGPQIARRLHPLPRDSPG